MNVECTDDGKLEAEVTRPSAGFRSAFGLKVVGSLLHRTRRRKTGVNRHMTNTNWQPPRMKTGGKVAILIWLGVPTLIIWGIIAVTSLPESTVSRVWPVATGGAHPVSR